MRRFAQGSSPRPHGVSLIFRRPVSSTGRLRQLPGGKRVTVRRQAGSHAKRGKRIAVRSRETAGAIRGFAEDRARQNNILWARVPRAPARARSGLPKPRARGKPKSPKPSRHRRKQRRRNPECNKGRDDENRIAARSAGPRSVLGAANAAREGESGGRRGCGEEALQQKRIKRERADRDAPCHRPLPEPPHRQSLTGCFRSLIQQKDIGRSERIRTSGPLVPNEVRYQAALHSAAPPDLFSGRNLLGSSYNGAVARGQAQWHARYVRYAR